MSVITKDTVLAYKETNEATEYTDLHDLQNFGDMGGTVDSIEITTMDSAAHEYTEGLISNGDNMPFDFLYETEQFFQLVGLKGKNIYWRLTLADGTAFTWEGKGSVVLKGAGTNAVHTYTLNIKPSTEITPVEKA